MEDLIIAVILFIIVVGQLGYALHSDAALNKDVEEDDYNLDHKWSRDEMYGNLVK